MLTEMTARYAAFCSPAAAITRLRDKARHPVDSETVILERKCVLRIMQRGCRRTGTSILRRGQPMNAHLQGMQLPADSVLDISIRVTRPLNVTAFSARQ